MTIPKIIHYVWVGPKPFPPEAVEARRQWEAVLPDYRFMMWTEENIDFSPLFIRQAYGARSYNRVANYARLAALKTYGGIYIDHDIELRQPFDALLHEQFFVGCQTLKAGQKDVTNNAVLGAVPDHWFTREALAALDAMDGAVDVGSDAGPGLLTRLLRTKGWKDPSPEIERVGDVALYPPRYFYPYEWDQAFDPACVTPDTIAIHHWDHSWRGAPGRIVKMRKAFFRKLTGFHVDIAFRLVRFLNARTRGQMVRRARSA